MFCVLCSFGICCLLFGLLLFDWWVWLLVLFVVFVVLLGFVVTAFFCLLVRCLDF